MTHTKQQVYEYTADFKRRITVSLSAIKFIMIFVIAWLFITIYLKVLFSIIAASIAIIGFSTGFLLHSQNRHTWARCIWLFSGNTAVFIGTLTIHPYADIDLMLFSLMGIALLIFSWKNERILVISFILLPVLLWLISWFINSSPHDFYEVNSDIAINLSLLSALSAFLINGYVLWIFLYHTIELEEQLISSRIDAKRASHVKSDFLANMSHELRTPMHGVLSFARMGFNKFDKISDEKKLGYFGHIVTSGERLMVLLNDLLDVSKLESGKMKLDFTQSTLKSVADSCILEQHTRLEELKQTITFTDNSIMGKGYFDDARIGQVITNLLSNAIKFTPENSHIDFTILESEIGIDDKPYPAFLFTIRDHGVGIPEGESESIFEKFVQSSGSQVGTTKGTGLGLAICKEIIRLHQGEIWAENHLDGGAVFSFTIPVEQPNTEKD